MSEVWMGADKFEEVDVSQRGTHKQVQRFYPLLPMIKNV